MPDWLIALGAFVAWYVIQDLVVIAALWIVHRLWGVRGVAWVLGKTEDEVMRTAHPRAPKSGPSV